MTDFDFKRRIPLQLRTLMLVFIVLFLLTSGLSAIQASPGRSGSLILFLGGVQAGREVYSLSDAEFRTEGSISLGGQTLEITSSLTGCDGQWTEYRGALRPGASFSAVFKGDSVEVEVGPLQKHFPLHRPFLVLENNVFAHYEQIPGLFTAGQDPITLDVVVPSLTLSNQNPVLQATVERAGLAFYQTAGGETLALDEYIANMPGNLQIRVLARGEELVGFELPMQAVQVMLEEYLGLQSAKALSRREQTFSEEEFFRPNGEITLAGTLSLPIGQGPFPVVLLNSGSGPQDRDGNTPPSYMTDMFRIFAERLAEVGIATLRYDERGVAMSTGDYAAATLSDLLSDVEALLDLVDEHPQIDFSRVAMLGHSEGAYFPPLFQERLQAMVLLAAPSTTLDQLMVEQLEYQLQQPYLSDPERDAIQRLVPLTEELLAEAREGQEVSRVLPINLEWVRQHMEQSPLESIASVTSPVLLVQGERDLKVMPYHAQALAAAFRAAGNEQVQLHYLENTSHEFLFFPYDNDDFDPLNPMRINPRLFDLVVGWLAENL